MKQIGPWIKCHYNRCHQLYFTKDSYLRHFSDSCEGTMTRAEKNYFADEYDKCFGTAPRSDES